MEMNHKFKIQFLIFLQFNKILSANSKYHQTFFFLPSENYSSQMNSNKIQPTIFAVNGTRWYILTLTHCVKLLWICYSAIFIPPPPPPLYSLLLDPFGWCSSASNRELPNAFHSPFVVRTFCWMQIYKTNGENPLLGCQMHIIQTIKLYTVFGCVKSVLLLDAKNHYLQMQHVLETKKRSEFTYKKNTTTKMANIYVF